MFEKANEKMCIICLKDFENTIIVPHHTTRQAIEEWSKQTGKHLKRTKKRENKWLDLNYVNRWFDLAAQVQLEPQLDTWNICARSSLIVLPHDYGS